MKKHLRHPFSLIELLLVVVIIGILATILVNTFTDMEKTAQKSVGEYNAQGLLRYLHMFNDANGAYPAGFHTGLSGELSNTPCEQLSEHMREYITDGALKVVSLDDNANTNRYRASLNAAGIKYLTAGSTDTPVQFPILSLNEIEGNLTPQTPSALFLNKTEQTQGLSSFNVNRLNTARFGGKSLAEHLKPNGIEMNFHTDDGDIVILFVTENLDWGNVYKGGYHSHGDHGHFENITQSKVGMQESPVNPECKHSFNYYIALFKVYKDGSAAKLIGLTTDHLEAIK